MSSNALFIRWCHSKAIHHFSQYVFPLELNSWDNTSRTFRDRDIEHRKARLYGPLIIAYLFFGGAAAGALFVVAAWGILYRRHAHRPRMDEAFHAFRVRVYAIGFILLFLAVLCLLWDLEHPERALLLFLRPHPTAITFGAYTLAIEGVLTAALFAACLLRKPSFSVRAFNILEVFCCLGAIATMAYTGVFLLQSAVALWQSWTLVGLFVFSSLSCGLSLALLADWFTQGQTLLLRAAKPLQTFHLVCLAFEAAFLGAFVYAAFENPSASMTTNVLMEPGMLSTATVGVIGMGIAVPALLEMYSLTRKECRTIPVSDAVCLFGGLCLRYCIISCGVH